MTDEPLLSISALANMAGITIRTIRYYIAEGLLPPPVERGARSQYGQVHLQRLEMIGRLKDRRMNLSEINHALQTMSESELEELLEQTSSTIVAPDAGAPELRAMLSTAPAGEAMARRARATVPTDATASMAMDTMAMGPPEGDVGDVWIRKEIVDGVEVHYRPGSGSEEEIVINRFISQTRFALNELRERKSSPNQGRVSRFFHRKRGEGK